MSDNLFALRSKIISDSLRNVVVSVEGGRGISRRLSNVAWRALDLANAIQRFESASRLQPIPFVFNDRGFFHHFTHYRCKLLIFGAAHGINWPKNWLASLRCHVGSARMRCVLSRAAVHPAPGARSVSGSGNDSRMSEDPSRQESDLFPSESVGWPRSRLAFADVIAVFGDRARDPQSAGTQLPTTPFELSLKGRRFAWAGIWPPFVIRDIVASPGELSRQ